MPDGVIGYPTSLRYHAQFHGPRGRGLYPPVGRCTWRPDEPISLSDVDQTSPNSSALVRAALSSGCTGTILGLLPFLYPRGWHLSSKSNLTGRSPDPEYRGTALCAVATCRRLAVLHRHRPGAPDLAVLPTPQAESGHWHRPLVSDISDARGAVFRLAATGIVALRRVPRTVWRTS